MVVYKIQDGGVIEDGAQDGCLFKMAIQDGGLCYFCML